MGIAFLKKNAAVLAIAAVEEITPILHGTKFLIMGNHDVCHPVNKKRATPARVRYLKAGFESLENEHSLKIAGQQVLLHHFPFPTPERPDIYGSKYEQYRPKDDGRWLLCGHVHEKWAQQGRMINVGVDVWDFYPVPMTRIAELITSNATSH
jgi:calcineurin-like phosphoesterase family protein